MATMLFSLKVKNDHFIVRTKFGRRYEFDITDINKIICLNRNRPKHGPLWVIDIYTDKNELELNITMNGFDTIAEYLLDEYEGEKIKSKVMPKYSRESLMKVIKYKRKEL